MRVNPYPSFNGPRLTLIYGSGLRVSEYVRLRVKDVDLERREIVVRGGKGGTDRRTLLAQACAPPIERVPASVNLLHQEVPRVLGHRKRCGIRT